MKYRNRPEIFLLPLFFAFFSVHLLAKDYMIEGHRQFYGVGPVVGTRHTLSLPDPEWPDQVTLLMKDARSLRIRIDPLKKPVNILMLASDVISPRTVRPVWGHDDLREAIVFWTGDYWLPGAECDDMGCPKIRFQMIHGAAAVTILEKRE